MSREEVQARLQEFGWSQNELARRIGKDSGLVSKVLRGQVTSAVVWGRIQRLVEREVKRRGGRFRGANGRRSAVVAPIPARA